MMNQTFEKFGWPGTRIAETEHWAVMLRPEQPTLGSVVLACKLPVRSFGDVGETGMADLARATAGVEAMLAAAVGYEKINYLMLMMVDPDVHFHVLPRHDGTRQAAGLTLADAGWPGPPQLGQAHRLTANEADALRRHLVAHWPG